MSFFKKLIFEGEGDAPKKQVAPVKEVKFPSGKNTESVVDSSRYTFGTDPITSEKSSVGVGSFQTAPAPVACDPYMDEVLAQYETGLNSLNQPGYDFFEYFQSVVKVGIDNTEAYKMALTMAQAMESSVTKDSLISQSEFYIGELNKVHGNFKTQGESKLSALKSNKESEEANLAREAQELERQINELKAKQAGITAQLQSIDSRYAPQISEVECKIKANDNARNIIVSKIEKVKQNINANL